MTFSVSVFIMHRRKQETPVQSHEERRAQSSPHGRSIYYAQANIRLPEREMIVLQQGWKPRISQSSRCEEERAAAPIPHDIHARVKSPRCQHCGNAALHPVEHNHCRHLAHLELSNCRLLEQTFYIMLECQVQVRRH